MVGNTASEYQHGFCRRSQYVYLFTSDIDTLIYNVTAVYIRDVTVIIMNYGVVELFKCLTRNSHLD